MFKYPKAKELSEMGVWDLLEKLLKDPGHASLYRKELNYRLAFHGVSLYELAGRSYETLADDRDDPAKSKAAAATPPRNAQRRRPVVASWPNIDDLYRAYVQGWEIIDPLWGSMSASDWNKIDPRKRMEKTPDEVTGFMESLQLHQKSYDELNTGQKNLLCTIIDSYRAARALANSGSLIKR